MFTTIRAFLAWLSASEVRRFGAVVTSNLITLVIQVLLVFASGISLALSSDTVHLGSDTVVTIGSFIVALISTRATEAVDGLIRKWFAFAGILLLWVGAYYILGEVRERTVTPVDIKSGWILAGGIIGGLGNLVSLIFLRTAPHEVHHNHTHAILSWHVLLDFVFSVIVIASALSAIMYDISGVDTWISYRMALFMIGLGGFLFAKVLSGDNHHH